VLLRARLFRTVGIVHTIPPQGSRLVSSLPIRISGSVPLLTEHKTQQFCSTASKLQVYMKSTVTLQTLSEIMFFLYNVLLPTSDKTKSKRSGISRRVL